MKKYLVLPFLALFLTLTACAPAAVDAPGDPAAPAPEAGGELVWVAWSDPVSMDPHAVNDTASLYAINQVIESLTFFEGPGQVGGLLATSFEHIDPYIWEFRLRQGVYFHDGEYFNAEAVRISLERALYPGHPFPAQNIINMIDEVVVIDDYTVHLVTAFPFSALPAHLTHNAAAIVSPAVIAAEAEEGRLLINENPIGTGPFIMYERFPGDSIVFVRNENYWNGPAYLDRVIFRIVPEAATRFLMLESGEGHLMLGLASDVPVVETIPQLDLISVYTTGIEYIGMNTQRGPLADRRVRQAISMAVNRDDIIMGVAEGVHRLAQGPSASNVIYAPQGLEPLPFDLEAARELLAETPYADGFSLEIWYNDGNALRGRIAEIVQANLAELNIDLTIHSFEWGAYLEATGVGDHDLFILGWTVRTGHSDWSLFPLYHSSNHGDQGNRFFLTNPELDVLLEQGRASTDSARSMEIYREAVEIILYEAPAIYLWHANTPVISNGVVGAHFDSNVTPFLHRARMVN